MGSIHSLDFAHASVELSSHRRGLSLNCLLIEEIPQRLGFRIGCLNLSLLSEGNPLKRFWGTPHDNDSFDRFWLKL